MNPPASSLLHRVAANLVVGKDGSTTLNGSSAGLSFSADRQRFHQLRAEFDVLVIGGNTARNEPYQKTPIPLIVLSSHPLTTNLQTNPLAQQWDLPLEEVISRAQVEFGDILIEAGPNLLSQLIKAHLLNELYLTISDSVAMHSAKPEGHIDVQELTSGFIEVSHESVPGGVFLKYLLAPSR